MLTEQNHHFYKERIMGNCEYIVRSARFSGEPPEPPEYCEDEAVEGYDYCAEHLTTIGIYPEEAS